MAAESKYLQVTPEYKAMSLDDRMRHVALYKPEYEKQQDAYDKLLEDTLILENLKGSDVDADLYRQYSQWRGELVNAADTLSSTGVLDMQSARDLRRQYLNELKPMEDRYKHRTNLVFKQASEASPDVLYKRDFSLVPVSDISLDDAVEKISLKDISKTYTDRWSGLFSAEGIPSETSAKENAIESAMAEMDLSGYSPDQVEEVRRTLSESYTKSVEAANQYNMQVEQAEATLANTRRHPSGGGGGSNPKLRYVRWKDDTSGVTYRIRVDSAGNYYDADGNPIVYDSQRTLVNALLNAYEESFYDQNKAALYKFNTQQFAYTPDGVYNDVGGVHNYEYASNMDQLSNIADNMSDVREVLKEKGLTITSLFANGYTIGVHNDGVTTYVKISKEGEQENLSN